MESNLIEKIKPYIGREVGTVWGPSIVKGFNADKTHVEMLEFGEEYYTVKVEDFFETIY